MIDEEKALMQNNFNRMVLHMIKQGEKSRSVDVNGAGMCAYRGEGGMRCGVGFLIRDEYYRPELEGQRVENPEVRQALVSSGTALPTYEPWRDSRQFDFLHEVQIIHDAFPVEDWEPELRRTAIGYGLTFPDALVSEMRSDEAREELYNELEREGSYADVS